MRGRKEGGAPWDRKNEGEGRAVHGHLLRLGIKNLVGEIGGNSTGEMRGLARGPGGGR